MSKTVWQRYIEGMGQGVTFLVTIYNRVKRQGCYIRVLYHSEGDEIFILSESQSVLTIDDLDRDYDIKKYNNESNQYIINVILRKIRDKKLSELLN